MASNMYPVSSTSWPTAAPIHSKVKALISRFYEIADLVDPHAGELYASEIFTSTGLMQAAGGAQKFEGEAELRKCREHAWDAFSYRHHEVSRVFVADTEGLDIMLIGKVTMTARESGKTANAEFVSRLLVDPISMSLGEPRLVSSTVWADSAPFVALLKA